MTSSIPFAEQFKSLETKKKLGVSSKIRQIIVEKNTSFVSQPKIDDQATKQRKTTYACDWEEKQFKDFGAVAEVKTEESLQTQDLETQEYILHQMMPIYGRKTAQFSCVCRSRNTVVTIK